MGAVGRRVGCDGCDAGSGRGGVVLSLSHPHFSQIRVACDLALPLLPADPASPLAAPTSSALAAAQETDSHGAMLLLERDQAMQTAIDAAREYAVALSTLCPPVRGMGGVGGWGGVR